MKLPFFQVLAIIFAQRYSVVLFIFAICVWFVLMFLSQFVSFIRLAMNGIYTNVFSNILLNSSIAELVLIIIGGIFFAVYILVMRFLLSRKFFVDIGGTVGIGVALLASGCLACGAGVLLPILSAIGVVGLLPVLPFHGLEILTAGVVILMVSLFFLFKKVYSCVHSR